MKQWSDVMDSWLETMYEDQHGYPLDVMDDPSDPMSRECDQCGAEPYEACRWFCLSHEDSLADSEDWDV